MQLIGVNRGHSRRLGPVMGGQVCASGPKILYGPPKFELWGTHWHCLLELKVVPVYDNITLYI